MATTGGGRGNGRGGGRGQDGSFSISGVAPGSYTLVATMETRGRGRNGGDVQLSGFANVEVGQQDVENIAVQVQPAVTIRGQIWIETETAGDLDLDDLRVRLQPPRDIPLGSPDADVEDDGTFEIEEVGQTLYRASLTGLPNDHYVVQARAGAYEALGNGIYVTSGMPPLEFWVSGAGATLEGTVNAGSGQVFTGAQVVLVPQDMRRQDLFKVAAPDQYGRFSMSGIAPGRYNVYAWEDLPAGAYLDPIFVNQYKDRAFALDVQKGVQTTARPHLIPATRPYR
jgi:hypothetical protein